MNPGELNSTPDRAAGAEAGTVSLVRALIAGWTEHQDRAAPPGAPRLIGLAGAAIGRRYVLATRTGSRTSAWTIGRAPGCDIVLIDPDLSRAHARIERAGNNFTIVDLDSKNGTRVGETPIGAAPALLQDGADVALGGCVLRFEHRAARHAAALQRQPAAPSRTVKSEPARVDRQASDERNPLIWHAWLAQAMAASIAALALAALVGMYL